MRKWVWILVLLLLCGCTQTTTEKEKEMKQYPVNDITETFAWIGKTAEELGIDESYRDGYSIRITGELFGRKVDGTAYMGTDFDSPGREVRVREIAVFDKLEYRKSTEESLVERYGKAYLEGVEPYVASNGGATYWSRYWTGEGVITVSNGQNNDWYMFSYVVTEMPAEIKKQLAGLTVKELMYGTGVLFEFRDGEIEDLMIHETEYEGSKAYRVTFTRDGVGITAIIVNDGKALYDTFLNDGTDWTQERIKDVIDSLRCIREDGTGRIVHKNVFGAFWLIETDAPVTEESLKELETFILSRWLFKE